MAEKTKRNVYILSWILIAILSIILVRLIKLYDIVCLILSLSSPILFGYIFAWILKPVFSKITKKTSERFSIAILIAITVAIYALLMWFLLPILIENASNLVNLVNGFVDELSKYTFLENLKNYTHLDAEIIISSCNNLISFFGIFALVHIFGFYMLYNYDRINNFLRSMIPMKYKRLTLEYVRKLSTNMRLYIKGTLIDTLILFVISSILYLAIGLKYPIFLAVLSAVTNIIPFVGPYIGGIPAVLVGLSSSTRLGIMTLGSVVLAQTVESNIINPMIMSKCIKVNPLLIVISLTIMGKFLGLFGMIFAVPMIIILKLTHNFIMKYKTVKEKKVST